jgi:hypothetical protein
MASQPFTFFQTGNLTPDPPTTLTSAISGTNWTNSWLTATSGRAPAGLKVTIYPTATPGTLIQTTNLASSALYYFTTVTFNTGGTTGRTGPIFSAAKSALTGTPAPSTWYDSYFDMTTTGYQLWTVPATSSYIIRCAGAGTANGLGIIIETTVNLTQGEKIQILVGQQGIRYQTGSSGGCGGSFVASGSTPATGAVLVAAGGGGGTRNSTLSGDVANATTSTSGNTSSDGTGAGGSSGSGGSGSSSGWGGGGGGFTGNGTDSINLANTRGFSFVNGGLGGNTATSAVGGFGGGAGTHGNTGGGGGGGGYSGGGGSTQSTTGLAGGGGSFPSGATNIGTNLGPGYVTITAMTASIPTIIYSSPTYAYGTQYGVSVQTSNIQGKLSPAITAVATWLAQPTFTSVTMTGLTFTIIPATTTGATGYLYTITDTGYNTNTTGATSGSFTGCIIGYQYYANIYAIATNSQSILSANSASVWCLATPVITLGTGTNNIYSSGTRIVGTTFTILWTAVTNASNYTITTNSSFTFSSSGSITTTPGSGWTAYTFTNNGSIVVPAGNKITVDYLLVGGGGGAGGYIGGGGGGGYYTYKTGLVFTSGTYTFTIGQGGIGQVGTGTAPTSGGSTTITGALSDSAAGGGGQPEFGKGGSSGPFTGGSYNNTTINAGGGAGAGQNGANGGTYGGNGGNGIQNSITGTSTYYGGGGGGGWYTGNTPGTGGLGGGASGAASYNPSTKNDGTNGLGGGGGGSTGGGNSIGGNGGSGVVIIRVYSSTATITSPTVTTSFTVGVNASYYFIVSATATNSTSQIVSTATIFCLTPPTITIGGSATYISGLIFYIAWTAGDPNASGYTLYINGGYSSTLSSSPLSTTFGVSIGSSYYATLYATASYSTSAASVNSPTIYCLATPSLTVGSGTNNIYNSGTFISGTTFTATWSAITNATGYQVVFTNLNTTGTTTYTPTATTQTHTVIAPNRYYVSVTATADYSRSTTSANSSTIYCLTGPSITSGTTIGGSLGTTFTITWSQGDGNASGYTIFLNGTGTPTTTNSSTFTTPFTVAQGSAYYAVVYATASYSTSSASTTATIPCILLTFTLSISSTTLTTSIVATPAGYNYSYSNITLLKGNTVGFVAEEYVYTTTLYTVIRGFDYGITVSATFPYSSTGTGDNIPRSILVPCILITFTLSISGSTLTPNVTITPSLNTYDARLYSYTLSAYTLVGTATTNVANFTGLSTGTSYSVSVSATNYGLTEHFEMISLTTNSGEWAYGPTWNGWTFYNAGIGRTGFTWQPPGSAAASGNYFAFLQENGSYISHNLTGIVGATATLTFSYSYRNVTAIPSSYSVYWIPEYGDQVTISTGNIGTLTGWAVVTQSWTFSSTYTNSYNGVIKFVNNSPGVGDNALLIDKISVTFPSTNSSSGTITSGSVFCLATPVISSISFVGITITINWAAVANVNSSGNAYLFYYNGIGLPSVITPYNTGTPVFGTTSAVTTTGGDIGTPGSTYYILMLAIGPNTVSALSAASSTVACLATPVLNVVDVSYVAAAGVVTNSFYITWSAVVGATTYTLYKSTDGTTYTVESSGAASSKYFTPIDTQRYWFKVKAFATSSVSLESNIVGAAVFAYTTTVRTFTPPTTSTRLTIIGAAGGSSSVTNGTTYFAAGISFSGILAQSGQYNLSFGTAGFQCTNNANGGGAGCSSVFIGRLNQFVSGGAGGNTAGTSSAGGGGATIIGFNTFSSTAGFLIIGGGGGVAGVGNTTPANQVGSGGAAGYGILRAASVTTLNGGQSYAWSGSALNVDLTGSGKGGTSTGGAGGAGAYANGGNGTSAYSVYDWVLGSGGNGTNVAGWCGGGGGGGWTGGGGGACAQNDPGWGGRYFAGGGGGGSSRGGNLFTTDVTGEVVGYGANGWAYATW